MMGWYGGGMTGVAWVGMGLFWLVLVGVIVWLATRLWNARPQEPPAPRDAGGPGGQHDGPGCRAGTGDP